MHVCRCVQVMTCLWKVAVHGPKLCLSDDLSWKVAVHSPKLRLGDDLSVGRLQSIVQSISHHEHNSNPWTYLLMGMRLCHRHTL